MTDDILGIMSSSLDDVSIEEVDLAKSAIRENAYDSPLKVSQEDLEKGLLLYSKQSLEIIGHINKLDGVDTIDRATASNIIKLVEALGYSFKINESYFSNVPANNTGILLEELRQIQNTHLGKIFDTWNKVASALKDDFNTVYNTGKDGYGKARHAVPGLYNALSNVLDKVKGGGKALVTIDDEANVCDLMTVKLSEMVGLPIKGPKPYNDYDKEGIRRLCKDLDTYVSDDTFSDVYATAAKEMGVLKDTINLQSVFTVLNSDELPIVYGDMVEEYYMKYDKMVNGKLELKVDELEDLLELHKLGDTILCCGVVIPKMQKCAFDLSELVDKAL